MLTYSAMPRTLNTMHEGPVAFPAEVELRAYLAPEWLFGTDLEVSGKRVVVGNSTGVTILFNANTGRWSAAGGTDLQPLQVTAELTGNTNPVVLVGNCASYRFTASSYAQIAGAGDSLAYALPAVLNAFLQEAPLVQRVTTFIDGAERGYEVWSDLVFRVGIVSAEDQKQRIERALRSLPLFSESSQRRLQAAVVYFHRAVRLSDAGFTRWEFLAEAVLNLAKTLEALFPGAAGETQNATRVGLKSFGFSDDRIEAWFTPAHLLRNKLDVGHVSLAQIGRDQVPTLSRYFAGALGHFRELLQALCTFPTGGAPAVEPYVDQGANADTKQMLDRIAAGMLEYQSKHGEHPDDANPATA